MTGLMKSGSSTTNDRLKYEFAQGNMITLELFTRTGHKNSCLYLLPLINTGIIVIAVISWNLWWSWSLTQFSRYLRIPKKINKHLMRKFVNYGSLIVVCSRPTHKLPVSLLRITLFVIKELIFLICDFHCWDRCLFLELVERCLEPWKQVSWSHSDLRNFLTAYSQCAMEVDVLRYFFFFLSLKIHLWLRFL